ncbi:hypothetical protein [Virgibacillus sp. DJP39]|uniref:hypothetical protein n=1 Tax=Virgibacillus sp. DJP39 TaxID=3409790 RepID=UPI003BB54176
MGLFFNYIWGSLTESVKVLQQSALDKNQKTRSLLIASLLSAFAALLQSAGAYLPIVGYFISPFSTLPIILCAVISLQTGMISYFLTILLLFILQPTELVIFPFTTGLLGLAIGFSIAYLKKRILVVCSSSVILLLGISVILYGLQFPLLGPDISSEFSIRTLGWVYVLSLFYSWVWVDGGAILLKKLGRIFPRVNIEKKAALKKG